MSSSSYFLVTVGFFESAFFTTLIDMNVHGKLQADIIKSIKSGLKTDLKKKLLQESKMLRKTVENNWNIIEKSIIMLSYKDIFWNIARRCTIVSNNFTPDSL